MKGAEAWSTNEDVERTDGEDFRLKDLTVDAAKVGVKERDARNSDPKSEWKQRHRLSSSSTKIDNMCLHRKTLTNRRALDLASLDQVSNKSTNTLDTHNPLHIILSPFVVRCRR